MPRKKLHVGHSPMIGVKSKFMKSSNKTFLYITIGVDIQKQFGIKKGSRLLLQYDKKNPFKIVITKTKIKEFSSYAVLQGIGALTVHICPVWKFKKPKAIAFKKSQPVKVKVRKDGFSIEINN